MNTTERDADTVWVVEGDDGEVVHDNPDTGQPWTCSEAITQQRWGRLHGQDVTAYQLSERDHHA